MSRSHGNKMRMSLFPAAVPAGFLLENCYAALHCHYKPFGIYVCLQDLLWRETCGCVYYAKIQVVRFAACIC
jgi:hypothetical protein